MERSEDTSNCMSSAPAVLTLHLVSSLVWLLGSHALLLKPIHLGLIGSGQECQTNVEGYCRLFNVVQRHTLHIRPSKLAIGLLL